MSANQLIYAMLSHPGLVRRGNEDACAASLESGAFVVCDGMGGAAAGEVASHLAAKTFLSYLTSPTTNGNHAASPQARLCAAIHAANQAVYQHSRQSSRLAGMGTTLVALLAPVRNERSEDPVLWLAHVGDSRCYRLRHGHLQQLTHDHSLVGEQLRAGQITPAQAVVSPMRNIITRAIGSRPGVVPEIESHYLRPNDLYLLASDGLSHEISDCEIETILAAIPTPATQSALTEACEVLIAAANGRGGHDNITVLLVSISSTYL
ncbi:protein phosphatase 2C domain-containing protein [Edaphobacter paludis]|uniref:Protein phosphatase 2C domain-containing protein n=1 Tax=Edaphobacter paludis TaxID=3035702 RepID=A0AAU7D5Y8_9BACT